MELEKKVVWWLLVGTEKLVMARCRAREVGRRRPWVSIEKKVRTRITFGCKEGVFVRKYGT